MVFKVLLTGADGMLGQALKSASPADLVLECYSKEQLDISQQALVAEQVAKSLPDAIINAAAYTQVDLAKTEPEKAFAVNRDGALYLAQSAAKLQIPLVHFSTDYVFDGLFEGNITKAYTEEDSPHPVNVYGASKLAGEKALLSAHKQVSIIRTSTIFSALAAADEGDFVSWVLKQAVQQKTFKVVDSWVSCPTPAEALAGTIWQLVRMIGQGEANVYGLWHYAGSPAISRFEWAMAIIEMARKEGVFDHSVEVQRCSADDLHMIAKRPAYSALDCRRIEKELGIIPVNWHETVRQRCSTRGHS